MSSDLQKTITDAVTYLDPERAREVLSAVAKTPGTEIAPEDLVRLNYLRLTSLNEDRVLDLVKRSVLTPYTMEGYSLEQKFIDYIEQLDYVPFIMDFVYKLRDTLSGHQEFLGTKPINVGGRNVPPTVGNWLADYLEFTRDAERDALQQLKYINNAPNVKFLSLPQKRVLQNLITIYDHLSNYIEAWESIPDDMSPEEKKRLQDRLTKIFDAEASVESASAIPTGVGTVAPPVPTTPNFKIPTMKDLDLSTRERSGLIFDQKTNVDLDEESKIRAEEKRNQSAIQAKLEALKRRSGVDEEHKQ